MCIQPSELVMDFYDKLPVEELIAVHETPQFDKHRRHIIRGASNEQLLALKLELTETLGILELHSRPDNAITAWYAQKLAGLLGFVEDVVISDRRKRNNWDDER